MIVNRDRHCRNGPATSISASPQKSPRQPQPSSRKMRAPMARAGWTFFETKSRQTRWQTRRAGRIAVHARHRVAIKAREFLRQMRSPSWTIARSFKCRTDAQLPFLTSPQQQSSTSIGFRKNRRWIRRQWRLPSHDGKRLPTALQASKGKGVLANGQSGGVQRHRNGRLIWLPPCASIRG